VGSHKKPTFHTECFPSELAFQPVGIDRDVYAALGGYVYTSNPYAYVFAYDLPGQKTNITFGKAGIPVDARKGAPWFM
jgi:hypothetical protein